MIEWGINALNHDASIAVFDNNELLFHRRSSEYSGKQGDPNLNEDIVGNALRFGYPDKIYWYERPWIKKTRQLRAGQFYWAANIFELPSMYLQDFIIETPISYTAHHLSHAAAGYYTSPFNHCAVVVIDAIGEWESMSIWQGSHNELKKLWSRSYPESLGLFYSAFTKLIGLKPTQEEHLLQKLSNEGDASRYYNEVKKRYAQNLHRGVTDWPYEIDDMAKRDIAASVQQVFEERVDEIMTLAQNLTGSKSLVYMGGCAMNSKYNQRLEEKWQFTWSLPWPGDASSAVGAWAAKKKIRVDYSKGLVKHLNIRV